ncbi:MAG: aldo/keto reductase [Planctomycetota bacterium]|nr:MAG: aldo/keto reductase [Planctomycetota bacterium]
MEKIELGKTGIMVTPICFGAWEIGGEPFFKSTDKSQAVKAINTALDIGINFIDTAPIYGFGRSEEILGEALEGKRKDVVLATKCGIVWEKKVTKSIRIDDSRKVIEADVERSLERLQTDYIDLYQVHWPEKDMKTPMEETIGALESLKEKGKIRAYGVSNFSRELLESTLPHGSVSTVQNQFSIVRDDKQDAEFEFCKEHGLSFMAYSPLNRGLLTDKFEKNFKEDENMVVRDMSNADTFESEQTKARTLYEIARDNNISLSNLALNYTLNHTGIDITIVGSKTPAHVEELKNVFSFTLNDKTVGMIEKVINS